MLNHNIQITNYKQGTIYNTQTKPANLEQRTLEFSKAILKLCELIPRTIANVELIKQVIRSGSSIGANYREANEALGKKDLNHRLRITRKEAKETTYWLELLLYANPCLIDNIDPLLQESRELRNIITAILGKVK